MVSVSQGGLLKVILASRMTGNPQISGEISGQNHVLFCREWGLVKITRYLCREWGLSVVKISENFLSKEIIYCQTR